MSARKTSRTILNCLFAGVIACGAGGVFAADAKPAAPAAPAAPPAAPVPAQPEKIVWPAWQIPAATVDAKAGLSIESDAAAESIRPAAAAKAARDAAAKLPGAKADDKANPPKDEPVALMQRVSRGEIAKRAFPLVATPVVKWGALKPGVYRVSARLAWDGDTGVIGTPIVLSVHVGGRAPVSRSFYSVDLDEPGKFQTISFLYEIDPAGTKKLDARQAYIPTRWSEYIEKLVPGALAAATPAPKPPEGFVVSLDLPITKASAEIGLPPNSLRNIKIDWLKVEKVETSPSITVRYAKATKLWIRPGMEQPIEVLLENFTGAQQKRSLNVYLVRGVDEKIAIGTQDVDLAAGAQQKVTFNWKTTPTTPIWGYEVVAEIKSGEKIESSAKDFFTVSPQVYQALSMGSNWRAVDPFRENESFQNLQECFGATRGDCAEMTVAGETWTSGMLTGGVPFSYRMTKGATDLNREQGIATHAYLFAGGTGSPLIDLYEKHPEWMAARLNTLMDEVYRKSVEYHEWLAKQDTSKGLPTSTGKIPHAELGFLWWDPKLMDRVTKDAVGFIQKSGYDGIRFDVGMFGPTKNVTVLGTSLPYDMKDAMKVGAKNFEQFAGALQKVDPNFEFGANMDTWAYLEQVGVRDVTAKPPEEYPEWVSFAKAGGMFMDEGTMEAPGYSHYMNRFEDALWGMRQKCAVARKYGGVYQLFSPYRNGNGYFAHDDIYWSVFIITSGSVYVGRFSAPPYSDASMGAFVTRYGEYFRSKGLQPLTGVEDKIAVNSPAALWFNETAVWEDIGNKRRYVVPLINPPIAERFRRNKTGELPPPIKEAFDIRVKVPEGFKSAKAWMLTWEPTLGMKELRAKKDGEFVSVDFPGIDLCRTLVVEFEK